MSGARHGGHERSTSRSYICHIQGADKRPYAVLFPYGATEHGHRELLGFQIHRSEGTANWECMLNDLVDRGLDAKNLKLVIRDQNSGCNDAVLSILGPVPQQACVVHLEGNTEQSFNRLLAKSSSSKAQARKRLMEVFDLWESVEPKACLALRHRVDASLVFYHIASDGRLTREHSGLGGLPPKVVQDSVRPPSGTPTPLLTFPTPGTLPPTRSSRNSLGCAKECLGQDNAARIAIRQSTRESSAEVLRRGVENPIRQRLTELTVPLFVQVHSIRSDCIDRRSGVKEVYTELFGDSAVGRRKGPGLCDRILFRSEMRKHPIVERGQRDRSDNE